MTTDTVVTIHPIVYRTLARMDERRHTTKGLALSQEEVRRLLDLIDHLLVWRTDDPRMEDMS